MSTATSPAVTGAFAVEREGKAIVVTPLMELRELAFEEIEAGGAEVLAFLEGTPVRDVVVDFQETDLFGSTALTFFLRLWRAVRQRNGRMAFANVSEHEREILRATRLDGLWPLYPSREEALRAVSE